MQKLKPPEAQSLLESGAFLVDLEAGFSLAEIARGENLPPAEAPLLVTCRLGHKSELAGLYLEARGYQVYLWEK